MVPNGEIVHELTKEWPEYARIVWNRLDKVESRTEAQVGAIDRRVARMLQAIWTVGAVIATVLFLTTDPTSLFGRLARMFMAGATGAPE